ncbi:MAG: GNAT family N-acetyltransferase [Chitinophagaceae bacterium]
MGNVIIKKARSQDAALIAEMSRQTFYDSFADSNTKEDMDKFMEEQFSVAKLMKEVHDEDGIFFIAYVDEAPVGYVRMRDGERFAEFDKLSSIEIARIYAVKSAIGKGVGPALIQQCMDTATALDRKIIWLGVWERNERAIRFYSKWGFEKFGKHDFILGKDVQTDLLMMKHL